MRKSIKSLVVISFLCLGCFSGCENADDVNGTIVDNVDNKVVTEKAVTEAENEAIDSSVDNDDTYSGGSGYTPYNKTDYNTNINEYGMDKDLAQKLDEWDRKADERDSYYERDYNRKVNKYSNW